MTTILGLSGSLRRTSFNSGLLRAAQQVAPDGVTLTIGSIRDVPLYDGDLETAEGIPSVVKSLVDQLAAADGLLLATPEYNNGVPGVLKNTIDWMSRGDGLKVFKGKPVAVIGASPGSFGTAHAQSHWLPVLRMLSRPLDDIVAQARRLAPQVPALLPEGYGAAHCDCESQIGSGALPTDTIPSAGLRLTGRGGDAPDRLAAWLRVLPRPIVGHISDGALILALRCLGDDADLLNALSQS